VFRRMELLGSKVSTEVAEVSKQSQLFLL
jgi:hypothetical protein